MPTTEQMIAQSRAQNDRHQTDLRKFSSEASEDIATMVTVFIGEQLLAAKKRGDVRMEVVMSLASCKWVELCLEREDLTAK